jgi:hypothetical protein
MWEPQRLTTQQSSAKTELAEETEVPGENLLQYHNVYKSHMTRPGIDPGAGELPPDLRHETKCKG